MFNHVFRALRHRNYRIFFAGQSVSLVGTWMQHVAMSWLVYRLTNSALLLGLVGFVSQVPSIALSPFAGVLVDHWDRKKIVIVTQSVALLQAGLLAVFVFTGSISVAKVMLLGAVLGMIGALDIPARHAFIADMIDDRRDLDNAIALNSLMFNAARLVGPAIAGVLVATAGEGVCFVLNACSYAAVIVALLFMRMPLRSWKPDGGDAFTRLKEGIRYAFGSAPIRSLLMMVGLMSMLGMAKATLMPVFARDILKGGAHTLGFLVAATGSGAFAGAVFLASRKDSVRLVKFLPWATGGFFGGGVILFSFSTAVWLSMALLFLSGVGLMLNMVLSSTALQTIVDDRRRGRVMSFYTMAFMGMATFGALIGGSLAQSIGAQNAVRLAGLAAIAVSMNFARQAKSLDLPR